MNLTSRFFAIAVVVIASVWAFASGGIRFGLDLAGGAALAYGVQVEDTDAVADADGNYPLRDATKEEIQRLLDVQDNRLNAIGLGGIGLTASDDSEILVEIPGTSQDQLTRIKGLIEQSGDLEFRIVAPESFSRTERVRRVNFGDEFYETPAGYRWVPHGNFGPTSNPETDYLVIIEEADEQAAIADLEARQAAGETITEDQMREAQRALADEQQRNVFRGADLAKTNVQRLQVQIVVFFEMRTERKADFGDFTERNIDNQMAIILDGKIDSAPVINSKLPGSGIIEGGGSPGFTPDEAKELSIVLQSGATGAHLSLEREEQLGPSLGLDAINRGKLSIAIGFICVLLVMLWLYRGPGMVANIALLLNVLILLGALAFFHAALTLAGIAGVVLTLGMAVDANILIFERLREEQARGKSLPEALAAGYDRALVAIVDANVTTVLTAIVLIVRGSGTVRGFGVTLTIGILASMFTAIYVTRTFFEWGVRKGIVKDLKFGGKHTVTTFDFMSKRKFFTGPSLALIVLGFAFFLSRPEAESKDLEFIGGKQVIVQLDTSLTRDEVVDLASGTEFTGVQATRLEARGVEATDGGSNRWQIRVPLDSRERGNDFSNHVEAAFAEMLLPRGVTDFQETVEPDRTTVSFVVHAIEVPDGVTADGLGTALDTYTEPDRPSAFDEVAVAPVEGDPLAFSVTAQIPQGMQDGELFSLDKARLALTGMDTPVYLSDPIPSVSFLNPGRAEQLWRSALQAVVIAMLLQIVYIRLRFADYKHGFAAVCALVHDVTICLGIVAAADAMGLVHAKINLVLIAAFLTLIGYSMNDTIVVFDRIRENLGKSKVVRTKVVNEALNQTLRRSIRTSITTWVVVAVQFFLNRGSGSVLEGFAFVMVCGVVSGTYSSVFIAGPLLLFLPHYWRQLSANRSVMWGQLIATLVGAVVGITAEGHGAAMWIGVVLAANIPLHFLWHFIPWLNRDDPDTLLQEEIQAEQMDRPIAKPGI